MLLKHELTRHAPLFLIGALLLVAARITMSYADGDVWSVIFGFSMMTSWSAVVIYSAYQVFAFYCMSHDLWYHISTMSRFRILIIRGLALSILLTFYGLLTVGLNAELYAQTAEGMGLRPEGSPGPSAVDWVLLCVEQTVAVLSFVLVLIGAVVISNLFSRILSARFWKVTVYTLFLVGSALGAGLISWQIGAAQGADFALGIADAYGRAPAFALIVSFFDTSGDQFISQVARWGIVVNAATGISFAALGWALQRVKTNF